MSFNFAAGPPELMEQLIKKNYPDYDIRDKTISGVVNVFEWSVLLTILHMTLPVTPVYLTIIWVRRSIIKTLNRHEMSESTRVMHNQLLKVKISLNMFGLNGL